ncbi:hypothetical protein Taro_042493 [Colocasia esculenta]|uniref:Uncharacterized protein n=1 Tax=Colocasia esculenta TaxID=4460 RepID=A0A843WT02_COLES|nr:hypothetical protein [Colocasia esculenta]
MSLILIVLVYFKKQLILFCNRYLWRNVLIDISDSFTCFDCLWFNLYTNPLSQSKVLLWIKEKNGALDPFNLMSLRRKRREFY